jgi:hypothetical protein
LRPAPGQCRTTNGITFIRFDQNDRIGGAHKSTLSPVQHTVKSWSRPAFRIRYCVRTR